jgi:hypothetical protein
LQKKSSTLEGEEDVKNLSLSAGRMITTMKTIDLVYFNAGGGHRSAALALETIIRELGLPWDVRLVNLFEVLDPRDVFGKTTGMKPEQYYNARLARG